MLVQCLRSMQNSLITSFIFLGLSLYSCSSQKEEAGMIALRIVSNEPRISHIKDSKLDPCVKSCADIVYRLVNNSDQNIMLYNFKRYIEFGMYAKGLECDSV